MCWDGITRGNQQKERHPILHRVLGPLVLVLFWPVVLWRALHGNFHRWDNSDQLETRIPYSAINKYKQGMTV